MRNRILYILLFLLSFLQPCRVVAQQYRTDTLSLEIHFLVDESSIDYWFDGNGVRIREFAREWNALKDHSQAQMSFVTGSTSPEGPSAANRRLSQERAYNLGRLVAHITGLPESLFQYDLHNNTGLAIPKEQWGQYRYASIHLVVSVSGPETKPEPDDQGELLPEIQPEYQPEHELVVEQPHESVQEPAQEQVQEPVRERFWPFALRTNLLLPALNVGVEVPLGDRWSIGADWYYPWLWRPKHGEGVDYSGWCVEAIALNIEGRYWFGKRSRERRLLGHSAGLFAMAGYYDFERNYKGLQGEFATVGVDYLYAMPIFKNRLHLEFCLGIGYFYSLAREYEVYAAGGKGYKEKDMAKDIRYFGPVKATVSLVLPIYFTRKGGDK